MLKGDKIDEEAGGGEVIGSLWKIYHFYSKLLCVFEKMNPRAMVVDEHLADVVMVYRSEIESFLQE